MSLIWTDEMTVGNAKIDNDHKYLISIINTIETALNCEVSAQVLSAYVAQLIDYSHAHFKREEAYQAEIKYPFQDAHKNEHKVLLEQIKQIQKDLQLHADTEVYIYTTPGLVNILSDWFMNHFKYNDIKMKEYFKALP
jgi:hemerythrin-like metal-binding protein